jgi:hypothetical protein
VNQFKNRLGFRYLWSYDHAVGPTLEVPLSIENFTVKKKELYNF